VDVPESSTVKSNRCPDATGTEVLKEPPAAAWLSTATVVPVGAATWTETG